LSKFILSVQLHQLFIAFCDQTFPSIPYESAYRQG
jgi:hypothetical protein